jgi:hypothetical protein
MQIVVDQEAAVAKQEAEVRIDIKKQQKKAEAEQSRTESKLKKQVDMYEDRNVILERKVKELQWDIRHAERYTDPCFNSHCVSYVVAPWHGVYKGAVCE